MTTYDHKLEIKQNECKHPVNRREYYREGCFKCWECGKIEVTNEGRTSPDLFPFGEPSDLKLKIKTAVWFRINQTIHDSGAREEKFWNESDPRDQELMKVLDSKTAELTERIMEIIEDHNQWEKDHMRGQYEEGWKDGYDEGLYDNQNK